MTAKKFDRATSGNVQGIKAVEAANDPYEQKNISLRRSVKKRLRLKAFVEEISESELIVKALEEYGL